MSSEKREGLLKIIKSKFQWIRQIGIEAEPESSESWKFACGSFFAQCSLSSQLESGSVMVERIHAEDQDKTLHVFFLFLSHLRLSYLDPPNPSPLSLISDARSNPNIQPRPTYVCTILVCTGAIAHSSRHVGM